MQNQDQKKTNNEIDEAEDQILNQQKRVDYVIVEYSLELLVNKFTNGELEIPDYQREYTWEESRKNRFIESLLMGLPIPFLFFWENPGSGSLEIVDGSQRIRTIKEFVQEDLILDGLEKLDKLNGFRFSDFPESRKRKFKNKPIRGIILNENADKQVRFDLFDRINTGSKVANKAEIRRGALQGKFMELIVSLATNRDFVELSPMSEKYVNEREREELITRFFAYGDGLDEYADEVSPFLFSYSVKMNKIFEENPEKIHEYRDRFNSTIDFIKKYFPYGFARSVTGKATPRARFEAISIGSYNALKSNPNIHPKKEKIADWIKSKEFLDQIGSDGANGINRLKGRIECVFKKLIED